MQTNIDLVYAQRDNLDLKLDMYLPGQDGGPFPLVIWIHGGGWNHGSKNNPPLLRLVYKGYAVASISYRFSQQAIWPAQIYDCKAAVRWLRAYAGEYNLDSTRFGVGGDSAGGHLAAMLGTSGGASELEGPGPHREQSSRVQAVCDFYGPTDLLHMNNQIGKPGYDYSTCPVSQLVGGPILDNPEQATHANPITYIDGNVPPFLIVHGDADTLVALSQSQSLYRALRVAGCAAEFEIIEGVGHGFGSLPQARKDRIDTLVEAFFNRHLSHQGL